MTTWRGHDCAVGHCDKKASLDVRTLPLCPEHALEVGWSVRDQVLAKQRRDEAAHAEKRQQKAADRVEDRGEPTVYYARIGDYIKIGFTRHLHDRLRTLRIDELLAIEPGMPVVERQRHAQFAAERIDKRRENFRPSKRLLDHIHGLRERYEIPRWATLPRTSVVTRRRASDQ